TLGGCRIIKKNMAGETRTATGQRRNVHQRYDVVLIKPAREQVRGRDFPPDVWAFQLQWFLPTETCRARAATQEQYAWHGRRDQPQSCQSPDDPIAPDHQSGPVFCGARI